MQDFTIENLVLDAAPLLSTAASSSASSLRGLAKTFLTTPDVISEIRDKTSRDLFSATLQVLGLENQDPKSEYGGLHVKEATPDAISKVSNFAKLTGDFSVLSEADIRVLALTYALEVEKNGTRRLRPAPGRPSVEEQERESRKQERLAKSVKGEDGQEKQERSLQQPKASTSSSTASPARQQQNIPDSEKTMPSESTQEHTAASNEPSTASSAIDETESTMDLQTQPSENASIDESSADLQSEEDDEDAGEWITPSNVTLHKSRDLGLFPSLPSSGHDAAYGQLEGGKKKKSKTVLKVACLTGDFAMQNVALQMGLNVFGVGGKKVREVRTWILRCHACFKLCKDPEKKFCPSCGNSTLIRTSITYVTPSPEHPQGYILHLKPNFQYRLRGTQFSIPPPRQGSSNALKNSANAELILREDQKEWQRGIARHEIGKQKQERAVAKAMRDGKSDAVFGGLSFDDPDWSPGMLMGEKGRSGGQAAVRTGKDGLPIIGYGRRNPNASGRKRK